MSNRYAAIIAGLPSDWLAHALADVAERITSGGTPSRAVSTYWNGRTPWVTPGELTNLKTKYLSETRESISAQGLAASGATLLPRDTLLVTTRATLGSVALTGQPMSTNQGFKSIVFGKSSDPSFYFHFFQLLRPELARRSSGTTFLEISAKQFGQIDIPVPAIGEQRRIAEILDTADDAIQRTERLITKLEQAKQGLLYDLLSPHGLISTRWNGHHLGELVDQARPIVYGILMPGRGWSNGVPVVKVKDIKGGTIQQDGLLLTSPSIDEKYQRSRIQPGDLLFTIRGTVGRMAFVPPTFVGANITQDTARIAITKADKRFIWYYLQTPASQDFIDLHTLGQAVKGINLRDVRKIPISLPPIEEQRRIAEALDVATERIRSEVKQAGLLRSVRRGLMDDLLTGRVRVGAQV